MLASAAPVASMPRVRWSWLWSARSDVLWNFVPFWLGLVGIAVLYGARDLGSASDNPVWNFSFAGRHIHLTAILLFLYGPLVDAPHLWATIARTYADRDEWATRRSLFIGSLACFVLGPAVILLPYALQALGFISGGAELGWLVWMHAFTFYALFHINKQHWGFIALYKRKNGDMGDASENRIDQLFFYTAIWAPYVGMLAAPWYVDFDGKPFALTEATGAALHTVCHVVFLVACVAYAAYQFEQYRRGVPRNGPKLAYLATILPLNYFAFSLHPLVAMFWVLTTGLGHCAQYHRVVWAYGQSKYVGKQGAERKLPSPIFENVLLYIILGVAFGVLTLQGFGAPMVKEGLANVFNGSVVMNVFGFLDRHAGLELAIKVVTAFVSGVRLHHFYVDSKIWRVGKSAALAKNLNVSA
jgi:hypothetical protein